MEGFLDLFSGTGEVALEALKRGASNVVAVESSKARAEFINARLSQALEKTRVPSGGHCKAKCLCRDARRAIPILARDGAVFDVIFADPPYGMGWGESLPPLIARHAFMLAQGGFFVLERSVRDLVCDADCMSGIFAPRDDRIYGDTVLSVYYKIMTRE